MRVSIPGLLVLASVLAGAAAPVRAQSLADVAKKEEERRKSAKDGGKTYTNKDLGAMSSAAAPRGSAALPLSTSDASADSTAEPAVDSAADASKDAASASKGAAAAADSSAASASLEKPGAAPKGAAKDAAKDQKFWSDRMQGLREQLGHDQLLADALQSRINALTTDFTNRDDPYQRAKIGTERQNALSELDRMKKTIEMDKKAIADAEEDARRSNVPPGWLR